MHAIQMPKTDFEKYLGEETLKIRQAEAALREDFATNKPVADPCKGLIPFFCGEQGISTLPLTYEPDPNRKSKSNVFMRDLRETSKPGVPVTVKTMNEFRSNFNRKHANVLHRLDEVLLQEPVVIAGVPSSRHSPEATPAQPNGGQDIATSTSLSARKI